MPPPANEGQIYEVTWQGRVDGQMILNIFHYVLTIPVGTVFEACENLSEWLTTVAGPRDKFLSVLASGYELKQQRVQCIEPTRYRYFALYYDDEQPGSHAGATLPSSVMVDVTKQSDFTGPHSHGQMRLAGIPATGIEESELTFDYYTEVVDAMEWLTSEAGAGGTTFSPVIFDRANPALSQVITAIEVEPTSRVSQRRVVGRGK